jgi:hypothetical protein
MKRQHYYMHNKKQIEKTFETQWSNKIIVCTTKKKHATSREQRRTQHRKSKDKCSTDRWRDDATNKNELH